MEPEVFEVTGESEAGSHGRGWIVGERERDRRRRPENLPRPSLALAPTRTSHRALARHVRPIHDVSSATASPVGGIGAGRGAVDDLEGDVAEASVVGASVGTQAREGVFHVEVMPFGDDALGLFDEDPAVEGAGELFVDDLGGDGGAVLEQGDGGNVGEGWATMTSSSLRAPGSCGTG